MSRVSMIAAIGRNRELGKENALLWHIPDDLRRFKQLTLGHPVVMGRKTFESILAVLGKPLPGRTNIIVTRDPLWNFVSSTSDMKDLRMLARSDLANNDGHNDGHTMSVIWAGSIEEAIEKAKGAPGGEEIFIGGGGQIYAGALPFTDRLYLTLIDDEKEGDSFFPEYEEQFKKVIFEEARDHQGVHYRWVDLER